MKTIEIDLNTVTVPQLAQLVRLKEKLVETEKKIAWVLSGETKPRVPNGHKRIGRPAGSTLSEEAKAKIGLAQKQRWAKYHAERAKEQGSEAKPEAQPTDQKEAEPQLLPPTASEVRKAFGRVNKKEKEAVKA